MSLSSSRRQPTHDFVVFHTYVYRCETASYWRKGTFKDTIAWAQRAAANAERTDDKERLAHAYYLIAGGYNDLGLADGIEYCHRALAFYDELSDFMGMGRTLNNLGIRLYYEGRWDEAAAAYERGRQALASAGASIEEATLANNIGEILSDQNRFDEAEPHFRHYLRTSRAAGFALGVGAATGNLARLAARRSRVDEAFELYDQVLAAFAERGSRGWWLEMAARKSEVLVMAGRHTEAIALARDALEADDATGTARVLLERSLGLALVGAADQNGGRRHLEESLRLARALGSSYEEAVTLLALAAADPTASGHVQEADAMLQQLGVVGRTRSTSETP